jgi:hypothetical protein
VLCLLHPLKYLLHNNNNNNNNTGLSAIDWTNNLTFLSFIWIYYSWRCSERWSGDSWLSVERSNCTRTKTFLELLWKFLTTSTHAHFSTNIFLTMQVNEWVIMYQLQITHQTTTVLNYDWLITTHSHCSNYKRMYWFGWFMVSWILSWTQQSYTGITSLSEWESRWTLQNLIFLFVFFFWELINHVFVVSNRYVIGLAVDR